LANFSTLKVNRTGAGYRIRIEGRGTLRESPTFHAFVKHVLESEPVAALVVLSGCDYLDSTFLGGLIDLHRRYGEATPPRLGLVANPDVRRRLLEPNCLDGLFHYVEDEPGGAVEDVELSPLSLDRDDLGHHVLECHRRLVELGGPARAAFQGVVDRLTEELVNH